MTRKEYEQIGILQNLFGRAESIFLDDVNPGRGEKLLPILKEGFEICIKLRSKYPPEELWDVAQRK